MARRPRISREQLVDEAVLLVDEFGPDGLSLATLAARLDVKPPSLYNHVDGLDGVLYALALRALEELVERFHRAAVGRAGRDALEAIAWGYRDFARDHPGLFALTQRSFEGRDEALAALGRDAVEVVTAVLHGYGLDGDDALHATRVLRSALTGFVALEQNGGFGLPLALDETFERLIALLDRGLQNLD